MKGGSINVVLLNLINSLCNISTYFCIYHPIHAMVLILDGNSEIGAPVWSEIGNLICLRHLRRLNAGSNLKFICAQMCATSSDLPPSIRTLLVCYIGLRSGCNGLCNENVPSVPSMYPEYAKFTINKSKKNIFIVV